MSRASRLVVAALLSALWAMAPSAQSTLVRFVDVAAEAGLDLVNVSGGASKDFIVDANGNGAAFFDYDNDRDLDALLVNGSTREHIASGGDPMVALYRNDGSGRFTDATSLSGFTEALRANQRDAEVSLRSRARLNRRRLSGTGYRSFLVTRQRLVRRLPA